MTTPAPDFQVGDWVTITGRIVELHGNDVDLGVEVFSKTDQYTAFVRRDLCAHAAKPIPEEPAAGSVALVNGLAYQRAAGGAEWWRTPMDNVGYSWGELQALGDVEVIHDA